MYCQCKNQMNYKVVGIFEDVNKFDTESEEAWAQITVPEMVTIPNCYPDIEEIERIYVGIQIDSTKVINTPKKEEEGVLIPNKEGTFLTGRKLLVDGVICQTIVYTADTTAQTLHSFDFKYPFCTYVVIPDSEDDIELIKYCIESCIEDVYAKVINRREIFKSVSIFLKPILITDPC